MTMQISIDAMKTGRFWGPVTYKFTLDTFDEDTGEPDVADLVFMGQFERVSDDRKNAFDAAVAEIKSKVDKGELTAEAGGEHMDELTKEFTGNYFVGWKKHPKHLFPFFYTKPDSEEKIDLESTPENIKTMMSDPEFRAAVAMTFARYKNVNQRELLAGNFRK